MRDFGDLNHALRHGCKKSSDAFRGPHYWGGIPDEDGAKNEQDNSEQPDEIEEFTPWNVRRRRPAIRVPPFYPPGAEICPGYTEIYGFARSTLGWNQLSGTKAFSIGPLTNIEFAFGADANTDNTTLGSAKRSIQAGLQFDFETPYRGFLNVAAYAYKEWQHDGFASTFPFQPIPNPSGNVNFDPTWAVEINYSQPLGFLPPWLPLKYKALVVMHGPKGCGEPCQPLGPGLLRTTEYLTQQILVFDVGQALWNLPQRYVIFGGYRWWKNKFGISPDQPNGYFVGTTESTWLVGTAMKF